MKICVDENIPLITVAELRKLGHDVLDIRGTPDQGISDKSLWDKVQIEKRLLITTDKGFASHRRESHFGILIIRLHQPNEQKIHQRAMGAVGQFADEAWPGLLVVMRDVVQSSWRESYQA
jgi:predicted nuclease of predicted toxin-antitoxin system